MWKLKTSSIYKLRNSECLQVKTPPWSEEEMKMALKKLKSNKSRDPVGMLNEIFKPGVIGEDLKSALLLLVNEAKSENFVPHFMKLANITSIFKKKGSKKSLENDR